MVQQRIDNHAVLSVDVGDQLLLLAADQQGDQLAEVSGEDGVQLSLLVDESKESVKQHVLVFVVELESFFLGLSRGVVLALVLVPGHADGGVRFLGLGLILGVLLVLIVFLVLGSHGFLFVRVGIGVLLLSSGRGLLLGGLLLGSLSLGFFLGFLGLVSLDLLDLRGLFLILLFSLGLLSVFLSGSLGLGVLFFLLFGRGFLLVGSSLGLFSGRSGGLLLLVLLLLLLSSSFSWLGSSLLGLGVDIVLLLLRVFLGLGSRLFRVFLLGFGFVLFIFVVAIFVFLLLIVSGSLLGVVLSLVVTLSGDGGGSGGRQVLDGGLEEPVEDLVDLAVENLSGEERIFVTAVVLVVLGHNGDVVNQRLQLLVIEVLDQFVVVGLELLQAVVVIEELLNGTVLTVEEVFNRRAALAAVVRPEVVAQEAAKVKH
mmetsp:Transcript_32815/g.50106  ORF Transcript_32815/g.50106 Transcript_32815/m.50106 type:complete len:426 (+) Transcript_32815:1600-2877(+)